MTRFVLGVTTLQFNCDPVRPGGERPQLFQQTGRSGAGDLYVYSKSSLQRRTYRLMFSRIDTAARTALLQFLSATAQGTKNSFTWIDHQNTARLVKFSSPKLSIPPVGPGHYTVVITLTEDHQ